MNSFRLTLTRAVWACLAICLVVKLDFVSPSQADDTRAQQLGLDMAKPGKGDLDAMVNPGSRCDGPEGAGPVTHQGSGWPGSLSAKIEQLCD